jgi:phenylpropionate dioxygenase-like ring-hydroxylating dioxygenase large terminal subunit
MEIGMSIHASPSVRSKQWLADLIAQQPRGHSLRREFYTKEAIFARDVERIFMRHWLCAGHESSAPKPGDYFLYEMGPESVIIIRGQDRKLRALVNVCRHRGSRVCLEKSGSIKVFVCPYHAWSYNLDGSLRAARHMPAEFDGTSHGLKQIHLEVVEGLVFISFADEALDFKDARQALSSAYGPYGWATAKVAYQELYQIEANWKLAVENYLECYHCAPSHREYSKLHALEQPPAKIEALNASMEERTRRLGITIPPCLNWPNSSGGDTPVRTFRYALYDGVKTGSKDGKPVAPLMGVFTDYDGGVTSTHIGPASFFIAYSDHGVIYRFMPRTAKAADMEVIWLVHGDAREGVDYHVKHLAWLWKVTTEADKRITEDNQRGVNSTYYRPGPYAPMEANVNCYIDWYLSEIT